MIKRISACLLAAALLLTLVSCTSSEERESRKTALQILRGDDMGYSLSTGTRTENQSIYDDGTIQIQLGGIEGTPNTPELVLAVKNGRRKPIYLSPQLCLVNGWQTDCWADNSELPGHSTSTVRVTVSYGLDLVALTDVATLELDFDLYDNDYNDINSVTLRLQLSDEEPADSFNNDGVTLLDDGDYKVVSGLIRTDGGSDTELYTYIENNTDRMITVSSSKALLNDDAVEYMLYQTVAPHARRVTTDVFYDRDAYDSIVLTDGDTLSYKLMISDYDSDVMLQERQVTCKISGSTLSNANLPN